MAIMSSKQVLTRPVPELGRLRLPRYQQRPATARIELSQDVRRTSLSPSPSPSLARALRVCVCVRARALPLGARARVCF